MKKLTRVWVRKAEADLRVARRIENDVPPLNDAVCFHSQQAAEKYLKALLEEYGQTVPRTHDLNHLLVLLLPRHSALRILRRGMQFLTHHAVDTRYPGDDATKRQAQSALRWAERIRDACRELLGIRPLGK